MEKWAIIPRPSSTDAERHLLLLKGNKKDVALVIKKLGGLCGRPSPGVDGYDFSLYLHGFNAAVRQRVSTTLEALAPGTVTGGASAAPASLTPPAPPPPLEPAAPSVIQTPPAPPSLLMVPPAPIPAPVPAAPPVRPVWGAQDLLDENRSFDTLSVGSYNRFAHAAAASAVAAPGQMYQPLFVYGAPGVGKTHMLHAIGASLAKSLGRSLWLTSGASLARAASRAVAEGKLLEFEAFAAESKALLVDDIHLMAVTEDNQGALAKLFKGFFAHSRQVVITSVYPPKALGALEEALNISFARGWSVDMKMPNPDVQRELVTGHIERVQAGITQGDIQLFNDKLAGVYPEFQRYVKRWAAFAKHRQARGQSAAASEVLGILFNPGLPSDNSEFPSESMVAAAGDFVLPPPSGPARNLAVIVPKGMERYAPWLLSRFHEVGKSFRFDGAYLSAAPDIYDPEQPFGVPFQIGEACLRSGAQACLILGPPADSKLSARAAEFSHAVSHILNSFGIGVGWIPHKGSTYAQPFLLAHLDFINQPGT